MSGLDALHEDDREQIVESLVSRHSLRATVRSTGIPQNRIKSLLMKLGPACARYQDETLRNLAVCQLEWREAFAFRAKSRNTASSREYSLTTGSVWTFACLDQCTKLVPSWRIGPKNSDTIDRLRADVDQRYSGNETAFSTCCPSPEDLRLRVSPDWFTALDRGFARKVERHAAVVALCFLYYNFARIHPDLGVTPAMATGKAERAWGVRQIVHLL